MASRKTGYKSQPHYKNELSAQKKRSEVVKRVKRNKARRTLMSQGRVSKGDGKDVHHKSALSKGGSNKPDNWQVKPAGSNRKDKSMMRRKKKYGT